MEDLTPAQALAVLERIEYSSDGFVKRYPEVSEYEAALAVIRRVFKALRLDREPPQPDNSGPEISQPYGTF